MSLPIPQPNAAQTAELARLLNFFPFRVVWGALSPTGQWRCAAAFDKREPNKLGREGWTVFFASREKKK